MVVDWNPLWPTQQQMIRILHDTAVYYPAQIPPPWQVEPHHMELLMEHRAWMLWIMNPRLDHLVPPTKVKYQHWVNMCVVPLHGPCMMAIRQLDVAFMHRIRCGEVVQSQRPRYISPGVVAPDRIF